MSNDFLITGPSDAPATILLAHGAGAAMDSAGMAGIAEALADAGLHVVRFEFAYMAARRGGTRKPPPRADRVMPEFVQAVEELKADRPLFIGGKSMGGRVATMVGDDLHEQGKTRGVLCFGYPFHPPKKPDNLRTAHLESLATPCLIFQGTRDVFGSVEEVPRYSMSNTIKIHWMEDGDHDLRPRKRISGLSMADHLKTVGQASAVWISSLL